MHTTAEFEGFQNVIKYASLDSDDAQKNINYLGDAVTRLHLPMKQAYEQFSELQGGLYGTGVEGEKLRSVFEGVATAAAVLHMNADQFSRTGYAIKEIGELGTLQTRQMRMLAMALPGAMNIAAESMNMNTKQFHEAMEKGEISANKFLTNFSTTLKERFGAGLANAGNSLVAGINDMDTAIYKLKTHIGEDLKPAFIGLMNTVVETADKIKSFWDWMVENKETLKPIAAAILAIVTATKGLSLLSSASKFLYNFFTVVTVQATEATVAMTAFDVAIAAATGPIGLLVIAVGALAYAYQSAAEQNQKLLDLQANFEDKIKKEETATLDYITDKLVSEGKSREMAIKQAMKLESDNIKSTMATIDAELDSMGYTFQHSKKAANLYERKENLSQQLSAVAGYSATTSKAGKTTAIAEPTKDISPKGATGQKITTINVSIGKLIEKFTISTTNISESTSKVRELVAQSLISAVNDSEVIAGM